MEELLRIKETIMNSKEVAIFSHFHPDGDALGSQIALALGLDQLGIKNVLINKDPVPSSYQFLPKWNIVKPLKHHDNLPETIIFVDCANLERAAISKNDINSKSSILINIDHHISNTNFADLNWINPNAAATAELIFDLLGLLQVKIDENIATALYTGLSTDTGSFLYGNTTPITHRIASDLINRGANVELLRINYYENISMSKIKLLNYGLSNLYFANENQVAWIIIDQNTFEKFKATDTDAEGLITYIKNIAGVEVAIVFRELNHHEIKISLRSKKWFDVNELAAKFAGGGHPKAAGCIIQDTLDNAITKVTEQVKTKIVQGGSK